MVFPRRVVYGAMFIFVVALGASSASAQTLFAAYLSLGKIEQYNATTGTDLGAYATGLNSPAGMVFDSAGNLYVANENNGTIQKITPQHIVTTFASGGGLTLPIGMAMDSAGNLMFPILTRVLSTKLLLAGS